MPEQIGGHISMEAKHFPPPVIHYEANDVLIHVPGREFCDDVMCPCHSDPDLLQNAFMQSYTDGLMSNDEVTELYWGRLI